jgi:23S rRNA (adenine2503-C2)-methyltransferase
VVVTSYTFKVLTGADGTLNWVQGSGKELFETRLVTRGTKSVVYLSSQAGCVQGCRMCHLTTTRQNSAHNARPETLSEQLSLAGSALRQRHTEGLVDEIHLNFMARGEPLANRTLVNNLGQTIESLERQAQEYAPGARIRTLISTTFPRSLRTGFTHNLGTARPHFYYSLYTADKVKHASWFPSAHDPAVALPWLHELQHHTGTVSRIHLPIIHCFNDTAWDWEALRDLVGFYLPAVEYNIVRYNPPDAQTREAPESVIADAARFLRARVVPRVGYDVFASCGMFVA